MFPALTAVMFPHRTCCSRGSMQHNPPPVIAYILRHLLRRLRPNGVAYLQVPTYCEGYEFRLPDYLASQAGEMEMHVLPQRHIFDIAAEEGCRTVEVCTDNYAGGPGLISNTLLIQKLPG
jgi:SAM-dependent methyltransferase